MPAFTPNLGYPYPLDGDPIDVAADIQKLAEAIDLDASVAAVLIPATVVGGTAPPGGAANVMIVTIPPRLAGTIAVFSCTIMVYAPGLTSFRVALFDPVPNQICEAVANIPTGASSVSLNWQRATPMAAGDYIWQVQNYPGSAGDAVVNPDTGEVSGFCLFASPAVALLMEAAERRGEP